MLILPPEVNTLDNFNRRSKAELRRLRITGRPSILTVNGKPAVVVQDARAYMRYMRRLDELDTLACIQEAVKEADAGLCEPADKVFADLRKEFASHRRRSRPSKSQRR